MDKQRVAAELVKLAREITAYSMREMMPYYRVGHGEVVFYCATAAAHMGVDTVKRRLDDCVKIVRKEMNNLIRFGQKEIEDFHLTGAPYGLNVINNREGLSIVYYGTQFDDYGDTEDAVKQWLEAQGIPHLKSLGV